MIENRYDVVVAGGGMAGCVAALKAAEAGASVAVVSRAPGATSMHSGAFDIDSDPFAPPVFGELPGGTLEHNIGRIAVANPHHPYAIIASPVETLRESLRFFFSKMSPAGLELAGGQDYMLIGNNIGTMKSVRMCLTTMAGGDFAVMQDAKLLVIGIRSMDSFNAGFAAAAFKALMKRRGMAAAPYNAVGETVALQQESFCNLSPYRAVELLGRGDVFKKFLDSVATHAQKHNPTHIAFPAVMGMEKAGAALKLLSQKLSVPCFELASTQPSVPGMRLQGALEKALAGAGVRLVSGAVAGFRREGVKISALSVIPLTGEEEELSAGAFVLATGKFLAGGLRRDNALVETVFDLPVFSAGAPARDIFMYDLMKDKIAEKQPIFSCGVKVDAQMRPLNEEAGPAWDNLFCAGSVIGGYDPLRDRCGSGVAIVTGFIAGKSAARRA